MGSRLICRRGRAVDVLQDIIAETGAGAVRWSRAYDPAQVARDKEVKAALSDRGIDAASVAGHVMFEPWSVETKTGGFYRVYSPFWRAVAGRDVPAPSPRPSLIPAPDVWPASDDVADWGLATPMNRGAGVVAAHVRVGEAAAADRLAEFVEDRIGDYKACLLYTSPSPRDQRGSRMPSSA